MDIIIVGFGAIGKGVAKVLYEKKDYLKENYEEFRVVAITDSSGAAIDENGLDLLKALEVKEKTGKIKNYPEKGREISSIDVIREVDADVVVEVTPSNLVTGEPAKTHILESF